MKIFISAAEASSDTHAAEFLKHLYPLSLKNHVQLQVYGVGGPKLRAAGLTPLLQSESLLSMGFSEIITRLPRIYRYLNEIEEWAKREKPDLAVLCDYPEFHFKLAARLKRLGIRTVCFIPPKVWVWRKSRIEKLSRLYDKVLSILPFEESTYATSNVNFEYVGNPLMDELPISMTRDEARKAICAKGSDTLVCLMVGSRPAELQLHLEPVLQAAVILNNIRPGIQFYLPLPEAIDLDRFNDLLKITIKKVSGASSLSLHVSQGDSWSVLKASDVGIIKSGTSSLEAALLDCPHVVIYRAHAFSEWIFKNIIRYKKSISLTNLILNREVNQRIVPELILDNFNPINIANEVVKFLDPSTASVTRGEFKKIRDLLGSKSPSLRVAEVVFEEARK